jgi:acetyltransferase
VNGVKLNLHDSEEVKKAWQEISDSARDAGASMEGALVQKMVESGQEVILGIRRDEQFGPQVLFGTGGMDVELLKDVKSAIAPLNRIQAENLVDATRAGIKLHGWRNQPPADREKVIDILMRFSQLASDITIIKELEINPLYVLPQRKGAYAVDVRGTIG